MDATVLGDIDLFSLDDLRRLASVDGPCLTLSMPTHRHGAETLQGPVMLRNLLREAEQELRAADVPPATCNALTEPLSAVADDASFWQHQADGLVAWSAPGFHRTVRVPYDVAASVTVGSGFQVRPVLPLATVGGSFLVLALSEKEVRLFSATKDSVGQLDLGPIPASLAEALAHEDREAQLQFRSGGADSTAGFHGHGVGDEVDKAELERYLRAVDRGLQERLPDRSRPLVLACVAYYGPIFRSVSAYPALLDGVVEGNPDRSSAADLHAAAWPLVEPVFLAGRDEAVQRYRAGAGTGLTSDVVAEIVQCAHEGRVDTLLVASGGLPVWGRFDPTDGSVAASEERRPLDGDLVDDAVMATVSRGGAVHVVDVEDVTSAAAVLRY
jgi:hypothetical protein